MKAAPPFPAKRAFWRIFLRWRFRLFQQHRHNHLVLERVAGIPLVILPGVFNPKLFRSGEFLARNLGPDRISGKAAVLDLGTGSGIAAIVAARWARRVVATDIDPTAIRCARINVLLNKLETKVDVRQGDLFGPVNSERFDLVLFNPPYFRGRPQNGFDHAWRGEGVLQRFAAGLPEVLAPRGQALMIYSTDAAENDVPSLFARLGLEAAVVASEDLGNEVFSVYRLKKS